MVKVRRLSSASARLVALVLITGVGAGTVLAATPADADPLASASAVVNKPPVDSLLSLCVTSQTLDPSGTCLRIGSSSPGVATSSGTATMSSSFRFGGEGFAFDGQITIAGQTFTGTATGSNSSGPSCASSCNTTVGPFALSGTSASGSLNATCWGRVVADTEETDGAAIVGSAVSQLTCDGSANGGPPGRVTLTSAYKVAPLQEEFLGTDYSGFFVGN